MLIPKLNHSSSPKIIFDFQFSSNSWHSTILFIYISAFWCDAQTRSLPNILTLRSANVRSYRTRSCSVCVPWFESLQVSHDFIYLRLGPEWRHKSLNLNEFGDRQHATLDLVMLLLIGECRGRGLSNCILYCTSSIEALNTIHFLHLIYNCHICPLTFIFLFTRIHMERYISIYSNTHI